MLSPPQSTPAAPDDAIDEPAAALARALNASLDACTSADRPAFIARHLIAELERGKPLPPQPPTLSPLMASDGAARCRLPPAEERALEKMMADALNALTVAPPDGASLRRAVAGSLLQPSAAAGQAQALALSQEEVARAKRRYFAPAVLRTLLTHDAERGGVPVRLLSARWLLTHFSARGNEGKRLEHRQQLEREHGDAPFVHGECSSASAELEVVTARLDGRSTTTRRRRPMASTAR